MELRPRCITCRQTGHTVCPVPVISVTVVTTRVASRIASRVRNRVTPVKCCSFCGISGHYKPKCEKYKIFVEEVKPHDADHFMIVVVDQMLKEMQRLFFQFIKSQFSARQILQMFQMSLDGFRHIVQIFLQAFDEQVMQPHQQHQQPQQPHYQEKIALELCANTSRKHAECGICLSDNIPCSKMVKLGCGHEFCGGCAEKFINVKPCCAFCRADVKKVIVASKTMQTKFKKNKKFSCV
jgi:hypothetical protein